MRRVIVSNLMTVDGYFEGPNHAFDWFVPDEEFFEYATDMLRSADTLLFGRRTYEHMANYWPTAAADEIAEKMNHLEKIVFSRSLRDVEWKNSRLAKENLVDEISRLKRIPGKDLVVLGSASIASALLELGLVDEYRIILDPMLLGGGTLLFSGITKRTRLKLCSAKPFGSGVVLLTYQKA
jgi:dihydrofolate reductase